jgi:outer membrane protein OmpA-like peptidoglycan-associated protein
MVPWNIGVRFNVYYEFYKNPPVKKQRRRRPRPKPEVQDTVVEEVKEIIPTDTIVYNGDTIQQGDTIIMENLYFDTDKSSIRRISDAALDELANLLSTHPTMKITLVGHTDNVGKPDYNQRLSEARVLSVKDQLIRRGIDGARIGTLGKGMTEPIADNSTSEGRAQNRRVEIIIEEQ